MPGLCRKKPFTAQADQAHHIRMDAQGRVVIPSGLRRSLGFSGSAELLVRVEGGALILESRDAVLRRLKARYQNVGGGLADELLAERRQEAAREGG